MLPQTAVPGSDKRSQPVDVQIRYTTEHGALLRSDGRTRPATLDAIEALFGEYVLNEMMEKYGRWLDVTVPQGVTVTARVNGRSYEIHVVAADQMAADFVVDTDEGLIILPINAPLFSLVQAIGEATQHEPPPPAPNAGDYFHASMNLVLDAAGLPPLAPIRGRPVKLDPAAWGSKPEPVSKFVQGLVAVDRAAHGETQPGPRPAA